MNESIAVVPAVINTYGSCVVVPDTDRFDCENYDEMNCPPVSADGSDGCYVGGGTDSISESDFGCKGTIEHTSLIIELNIPFEVEGGLSEEEVQIQRKLIRSTQEELVSQIPGVYEVYNQYTTVPNLAIRVNKEALEYLHISQLVENLQEDKPEPFN